MDPHQLPYLFLHADDVRRVREAEAAHRRLVRACRGRRRPSRVLRLYARLWWASRPRAAAWTPGLFDTPART
ncbi:hypothetical protein [Pseudonocardia kunmingensis]|uniref:Uncharacterized protein n=1 Tax=Pseudonocardia kunmingensis TaxID=630975 RepID=A0A543E0K3_9PSEU|nr:hypothetical protein [Pseudonocardia kunmingensis]TQM15064.1 hypothetical protein FB558_1845 [Pseudonocardia kunmingensis]